ncbi:MAG: DUF6067 family protein, partial [Candidatus Marinimicrobia bacterium]|nr:DUF6067 family protein [Candidatus Neomarinimicrobiota bacterium]
MTALLLLATARDAAAGILFHVDFEEGFKAHLSGGTPEAVVVGEVDVGEGMYGGQAAVLKGRDGHLEYAVEGNLQAQAGTIELWVRALDWDWDGADMFTLFHADLESEGIFQIYKYADGGPTARVLFLAGGSEGENHAAAFHTEDWGRADWQHLVVTWNKDGIATYQQGELFRRQRVSNPDPNDPAHEALNLVFGDRFSIGGRSYNPAGGQTAVDSVTIHDRVLSPDEIRRNYRRGLGLGFEPMGRPVLAVPLSDGAMPTLDSLVAEDEWAHAFAINGFVKMLAPSVEIMPFENRVYALSDGSHLYIGLVSENIEGQPLKTEARTADDKIFRDDCFEIMISPNRETIYKYDINAAGVLARWVSLQRQPTQAKGAASERDGHFHAELKIPLDELGLAQDAKPGDTLAIQFVRSYKTQPANRYAGLPWNRDFFKRDAYAKLLFVAADNSVAIHCPPRDLLRGQVRLSATVGTGHVGHTLAVALVDAEGQVVAEEERALSGVGPVTLALDVEPGFVGRLVVSVDGLYHHEMPFSVVPALTTDYLIYSTTDTLSVTLDVSGSLRKLPDLQAEILILDGGGREGLRRHIENLPHLRGQYEVDVSSLEHGSHRVECVLRDRLGVEEGRDTFRINVFRHLEGVPNTIGISAKVPRPWTPVEVNESGVFGVWGREYDFDAGLLPARLVVQGAEMLSAPMAYVIEYADGSRQEAVGGRLQIAQIREGRVDFSAQYEDQGLRIRHTMWIEYDGLVRIEAAVASARDIKSLRLRIGVKPESALFFGGAAMKGKYLSGLPMTGVGPDFSWSSEYMYPYVKLQGIDRGITWLAGSDRTWRVDKGRAKLSADVGGLTVTFIDTDEAGVRQIAFDYGLQALPARPARKDFRRFGRWHAMNWQHFFPPNIGSTSIESMLANTFERTDRKGWGSMVESGRAWSALRPLILPFACFPRGIEHTRGMIPDDLYAQALQALPVALENCDATFAYKTPYTTPTYASETLPEWDWFRSEWESVPRRRFPKWRQPAVNVAHAQWQDFYMHNLKEWIQKYRINGLFHDMAVFYAMEGGLTGFGYEKDGVGYDEFPVWGARTAFQRIYTLHREIYPEGFSYMNGGPVLGAYTDFIMYGEAYLHTIERSIYDLHGDDQLDPFLHAVLSAEAAGNKTIVLTWVPATYVKEREPSIHMFGLILLHDAIAYLGRNQGDVLRETGALKEKFGLGQYEPITFTGYWQAENEWYTTSAAHLKASIYTRDDERALMIVVNTTRQTDEAAQFNVALDKLGIGKVTRVQAFDPLRNTYTDLPYTVEGERLSFEVGVERTLYRAVFIEGNGHGTADADEERPEILTVDGIRIEKNIDYLGSERAEKADLYLPAAAPTAGTLVPGVVILHGGGWVGGSKEGGREVHIGKTLAQHGYVALSIDYLLVDPENPYVAVWPQNLHDCKTAVRWLRKNAGRLGIDPD